MHAKSGAKAIVAATCGGLAALSAAPPAAIAAEEIWRGTLVLERTITDQVVINDPGSYSRTDNLWREMAVYHYFANRLGQYRSQAEARNSFEARSNTDWFTSDEVLAGCGGGPLTFAGDFRISTAEQQGISNDPRFWVGVPNASLDVTGIRQDCGSEMGCQTTDVDIASFVQGWDHGGVATVGARRLSGSESWRDEFPSTGGSRVFTVTLSWDVSLEGPDPAPGSGPLPGFGGCDPDVGALGDVAERSPPPDGSDPPPPEPPVPPPPGGHPYDGLTEEDGLCPHSLSGAEDEAEIACLCVGDEGWGPVWGTDIYTDDSSLCAAAVHAGVATEFGGPVIVHMAPGCSAYRGSSRNGIDSDDYDAWERSFVFPFSPTGPGSC